MAPFLPLVSLSRSTKIRINGQKIPSLAQIFADIDTYPPNDAEGPAYVDLGATSVSGPPVWKEVAAHASIGQVLTYGAVVNNLFLVSGLVTTADGADLTLTVSPGTVKDVVAGVVTVSTGGTTTLSAAHATLYRRDLIAVNKTTGAITHVTGTNAATALLALTPAALTGTVGIASVLVAPTVTLITQANVTDVAPRS